MDLLGMEEGEVGSSAEGPLALGTDHTAVVPHRTAAAGGTAAAAAEAGVGPRGGAGAGWG
jgi:hypothetical protein